VQWSCLTTTAIKNQQDLFEYIFVMNKNLENLRYNVKPLNFKLATSIYIYFLSMFNWQVFILRNLLQ